MDIGVTGYLVLFALIFLAGFIDAAAGGGGLISLPAYLLIGLPSHIAIGCNKLSSSIGTTIATLRYLKNKALDLPVALLTAAASFAGSAIGSRAVLLVDDSILKAVVVFAVPVVAVFVLIKRNYGETDRSVNCSPLKKGLLGLAIGLLIGCYDGFIGPGTGTFAMLAFTALIGYDLRKASGNAKALNLASNYAAVITFAIAGTIRYDIALPAALFGAAGNYLGSGLAIKKGAKWIKPVLLFVMVLLLAKLGLDLIR